MKRHVKYLLGFLLFALALPARADIVYPARLELMEITPGVFEVRFVLPVFQGKVLKAQPVLPDFCTPLEAAAQYGDANSVVTRWRVSCEAADLPGQTIGIEGLLGSPIDIFLQITTLAGRTYSTTLSPASAFYQVPLPPSAWELLVTGFLDGLRFLLGHLELYLLSFLLLPLGLSKRKVLVGGLSFCLAFVPGQRLATDNWLVLDPLLPVWAVLGICVMLAWRAYARKEERSSFSWLILAYSGGLLGFTYGGVYLAPETVTTYLPVEFAWYLLALGFGVAASLSLIQSLCRQGWKIVNLFLPPLKARLPFVLAIFSFGFLLYHLSVLLIMPNPIGQAPLLSFSFPVLAAIWLGRRWPDWGRKALLGGMLTMGLGMIFGFHHGMPAWGPAWVALGCLALLANLGWTLHWPIWGQLLLFGPALLFAGWDLAAFAEENVSFAQGHAMGLLVALLFLGWFGLAVASGASLTKRPYLSKGMFFLLGMLVVGTYYSDYLTGYYQSALAELASGQLPVPLLAVSLAVLALAAWPRRRAIHRAMGVGRRKPVAGALLLALAVVLLPFGSIRVANPFYEPHPPDAREASRLLQQVLWQTYTAFNEEDEDVLYEKLDQSVAPELIDDLYLDSRRRLRSGIQEGAEVSVRAVAIDSVGSDIVGMQAAEGFTFPADWVVTARVKHLQHVHHRRNLYGGKIQLRLIDGQWKIARIMLDSEERVIVPASAG